MKSALLICLLLFGFTNIKAQQDSTVVSKKWKPQKKAGVMSAVFPGLGQAYNKKYWKLPIVYGTSAALIYGISYNHKNYIDFHNAYYKESRYGVDVYPQYSEGTLKTFRDYYRRNRDMLYILSAVFYAFQITDAVVDAHLNEFDLNDDLTLNLSPSIHQIESHTFAGLSLQLKLKK